MTGLLLDTNVLIPVLNRRVEILPRTVRDVITATTSKLFVSVASLWEIAIKVRLGKLDVGAELDELPGLVQDMKLALLVINARHAVTAADPEPETRDPFDRLLLAQAQVEGLRLVTLDRALVNHPATWQA